MKIGMEYYGKMYTTNVRTIKKFVGNENLEKRFETASRPSEAKRIALRKKRKK